MKPTFETTCGVAHVAVYGRALLEKPKPNEFKKVFSLIEQCARAQGAHNVLWQHLPSENEWRAYGKGMARNYIDRDLNSFVTRNGDPLDWVKLTREHDAVALLTRDCPTAVLQSETTNGPIVVCHAGRNQLHKAQGSPDGSVVLSATKSAMKVWKNPENVSGVVVAGIAAQHFPHDQQPALVSELVRDWGSSVIQDNDPKRLTIDLFEFTLRQAESLGIDRRNIASDGLDTFSDERLGSKRAERDGYNLVIVTFRGRG